MDTSRLLLLLLLSLWCTVWAESPPAFVTEPESEIVASGSSVTLQCRGNLPSSSAEIHWTHNGRDVTGEGRRRGGGGAGAWVIISGGDLTIPEFGEGDEGGYRCVLTNSVGTIVSREALLQAAYIADYADDATSSTQTLSVTVGNVVHIRCPAIDSVPTRRVMFEKDGETITNQNRYYIMPSGNLQIEAVRLADQGVYRCISVNPLTSQKRIAPYNFTLTVKDPTKFQESEIVQAVEKNYTIEEGESVVLECVVNGAPPPRVTWIKYGGKLPEGRHSQHMGNLHLERVEAGDQGTYVCQASNDIGMVKSSPGQLYITEAASIRRGPKDQDVVLGDDVTLECVVRGNPAPNRTWLYDGEPISAGEHVEITDSSLTLTSVHAGQAGMYQCMVGNAYGSHTQSAQLRVVTTPPPPPSPPDPTGGEGGGDRQMQDIAAAAGAEDQTDSSPVSPSTTPPDLEPSRGQKERSRPRGRKKGRNKDRNNEEEEEEEPEFGGGGRRKKKKNNKEDVEKVIVPPSKPSVSQLSDTSVKLEWRVEEVDNAWEISFFKIQYKQLDGDSTAKRWRTIDETIPPQRRINEVAGLKPGGTYRFRVVAAFLNDDNKEGETSRKFTLELAPEFRPKAPKNQPSIIKARPLSRSQIAIEWQYLPEEQSPIEGFLVNFRPRDSMGAWKKYTILGGLVTKHVIHSLLPDTVYSIHMQSFNTAGESPPGNTVTKKTLAMTDLEPVGEWSSTEEEEDSDASLYLNNAHSSAASHDLLYWILGVVLGVLLLILIIFVVMCAVKQRQHRNAMAGHRSKYTDPTLYTENSLHKHGNGGPPHFLLNGLGNGGRPGNGFQHGSSPGNGHAVSYSNGGGVNLHINPFQDNANKHENSLQELRNSLQEMLQQSPPHLHDQHSYDEQHTGTLPRGSGAGNADDTVSVCEQCEQCEHHGGGGEEAEEEEEEDCSPPYQPPEYHSLLRQPPPPPISGGTNSGPRPRHMSSFKPQQQQQQRSVPDIAAMKKSASSTSASPDHIPRSHERLPYHPRNTVPYDDSGAGAAAAGGTVPSPALYIPEPEHDSPSIVPPTPEPPVRASHARDSLSNGGGGGHKNSSPLTGRYDVIRDSPGLGGRYDATAAATGNSFSAPAHSSPAAGGGGRYDSGTRPYLARQYDAVPPEHYEQIQQDLLESEHSQSSSSHKSKRRRRKQRGASSQHNTDQSSNDGTLDSTLDSLDTPSPSSPPVSSNDYHHNAPLHADYQHNAPLHADYQHNAPLHDDYQHNAPLHADYQHNAPLHADYQHNAPLHADYEHNAPMDSYEGEGDGEVDRLMKRTQRKKMIPRSNDYPPSDQDELEY